MAAIGAYTIFGWRGTDGVQLSGMETRQVFRDGVSGMDVVQVGVRGKPFKMIAMLDATNALNLALAKIAFNDLQGNLVSVTDNFGNQWARLLVADVQHIKEERRIGAVGGTNAGTYWLETQFTFIPLATSYP